MLLAILTVLNERASHLLSFSQGPQVSVRTPMAAAAQLAVCADGGREQQARNVHLEGQPVALHNELALVCVSL